MAHPRGLGLRGAGSEILRDRGLDQGLDRLSSLFACKQLEAQPQPDTVFKALLQREDFLRMVEVAFALAGFRPDAERFKYEHAALVAQQLTTRTIIEPVSGSNRLFRMTKLPQTDGYPPELYAVTARQRVGLTKGDFIAAMLRNEGNDEDGNDELYTVVCNEVRAAWWLGRLLPADLPAFLRKEANVS